MVQCVIQKNETYEQTAGQTTDYTLAQLAQLQELVRKNVQRVFAYELRGQVTAL